MRKKSFYITALLTAFLSMAVIVGCSDDDGNDVDNTKPTPNNNNNNNNKTEEEEEENWLLTDTIMHTDDYYLKVSDDFEVEEFALSGTTIEKDGDEVEDADAEEPERFGAARIDNFDYSTSDLDCMDEDNNNGYHHYGFFSVSVTKKSTKFVIKLKKSGGFEQGGTAYLKLGHLAGDIITKKTFKKGATSISLEYYPDFDCGVATIYPMIISKDSDRTRSFSSPITIYTDPMYEGNYWHNAVFGTYNGVEVRCNGKSNANSYENQCVAFVKRFANEMYGLSYSSYGNAKDWWTNRTILKKFYAYENGGKEPPRPGDIIVFKGGDYGHIGVIMEVNTNYVKVVHQNGGKGSQYGPIGARLSLSVRNGRYTVSNMYAGTSSVRIPLGWLHHKTRY